jgi:hypothetical protein
MVEFLPPARTLRTGLAAEVMAQGPPQTGWAPMQAVQVRRSAKILVTEAPVP